MKRFAIIACLLGLAPLAGAQCANTATISCMTGQFIGITPMSNLAQAGVPFSVTLSAPVTGPLTWSTTSTTTQHGITFTGGSTGVVAGTTPTVGTSSWLVKWVSTSGFSYTNTVTVVIGSATSITVTPLTFNVTETATQQLDAIAHFSNSTAYDISSLGSWSCASGTGCSGTTISSAGLLTAGSTLGQGNGQISFGGQTGTFTATVQSASPSLSISNTDPLPAAQINQPYSEAAGGTNGSLGVGLGVALLPTGGTPPYTCSISSGSLPTGIALSTPSGSLNTNCFMSGTPTTAAAGVSFTVHVVDSATPTPNTHNLVASSGIPVASLSSLVVNLANSNLSVNTTTQATAVGTYSDSSTATLPNATSGGAQPYSIQYVNLTSGTTKQFGTPVSTTTGDMAVVILSSYTSSYACSGYTASVTSANETFNAATTALGIAVANTSPFYNCGQMFYAYNITGVTNDQPTVTWTESVGGIAIIEYYHGILTTDPRDQHATPTQAASVGSCTPTAVTTGAANEVLVEGCIPNSATAFTPPAGFTAEYAQTSPNSIVYADEVVNAIQTSIAPVTSFSPGAQPEVTLFATFKAQSASAGGVVWTSGTPACATVNIMGVVTAQPATSTCTSVITGTIGAVSNTATVTVTVSTTNTGILIACGGTIQCPGATASLNGTVQFTAVGNVNGNGYTAAWASSNSAIVSINASSGLATCVALGGPVNISASVSGFGAPSAVPMTCSSSLTSGIISANRAINWATQGAGTTGGIPTTWTQCGATIAPLGSSSAAVPATPITNAINACGANQYVQLAAGTFYLNTGIVFQGHNNVAVKGMGANQTLLVFTGEDGCSGLYAAICIESTDNNNSVSPTNGPVNVTASSLAQGATTISLASVPNLKVGNPIYLDQLDDVSDIGTMLEISDTTATFPFTSPGNAGPYMLQAAGESSRANRSQIQFVTVTQCDGVTTAGHSCSSGANITISPGLADPNWTSSKLPQAWWPTGPAEYNGVQDLSINASYDGAPGTLGAGIAFFNATNGWVQGVRTIGTSRDSVWTFYTQHMTVRENYFFLAVYDTSTSYGYECYGGSDALVEGNIFQAIAGPLTINGSCVDIVMDYNFATTAWYTSSVGWSMPMSNLHGSDTDFDIYEGNIGSQLNPDVFHGPHNMYTIFRNYMSGTYAQCFASGSSSPPTGWFSATFGPCTGNQIPLQIFSYSRFGNIIGNVLGTAGVQTAYRTGSTPVILLARGDGIVPSDPPTDAAPTSSSMLWGNWDVITNATRWCGNSSDTGWATTCASTSEIPTGYMFYPNPVPSLGDTGAGQGALPASFIYSSKPAWWPSGKAWPIIGPDVTGGNISGTGGHANTNPAEDCYTNTMGGSTNGGTGPFTFSRANCYPGG